jgi:hypothetical protein
VNFWRIVVSIILPPLGMFWQVGFTIPFSKYKPIRAVVPCPADRQQARSALRAVCVILTTRALYLNAEGRA